MRSSGVRRHGRRRRQGRKPFPVHSGNPGIILKIIRNGYLRINPELGLRIDGVSYVVKLYFKKETLSRNRVAVVLDMMNAALAGRGEDVRVAVLDVPAGKLIAAPGPSPQINALLESEAASFLQLWEAV
jgi:hypothetical protein